MLHMALKIIHSQLQCNTAHHTQVNKKRAEYFQLNKHFSLWWLQASIMFPWCDVPTERKRFTQRMHLQMELLNINCSGSTSNLCSLHCTRLIHHARLLSASCGMLLMLSASSSLFNTTHLYEGADKERNKITIWAETVSYLPNGMQILL